MHVATPVRRVESGGWVEGEYGVAETQGTPFACCLFLPQAEDQSSARGGRRVTRPTLLVSATDEAGAPVTLSNEDELLIVHPELNPMLGVDPALPVRWQVTGGVQQFGKPGDSPIGGQVTLVRVED